MNRALAELSRALQMVRLPLRLVHDILTSVSSLGMEPTNGKPSASRLRIAKRGVGLCLH